MKMVCTYIFPNTFPGGNEFGNIALILFRLRSNCASCGMANNASLLIDWISLFDKINVFNAFRPTKMGIFVNWLCFKRNFTKLVRLPILCSQRASPKLLCDNSLFVGHDYYRHYGIIGVEGAANR